MVGVMSHNLLGLSLWRRITKMFETKEDGDMLKLLLLSILFVTFV